MSGDFLYLFLMGTSLFFLLGWIVLLLVTAFAGSIPKTTREKHIPLN